MAVGEMTGNAPASLADAEGTSETAKRSKSKNNPCWTPGEDAASSEAKGGTTVPDDAASAATAALQGLPAGPPPSWCRGSTDAADGADGVRAPRAKDAKAGRTPGRSSSASASASALAASAAASAAAVLVPRRGGARGGGPLDRGAPHRAAAPRMFWEHWRGTKLSKALEEGDLIAVTFRLNPFATQEGYGTVEGVASDILMVGKLQNRAVEGDEVAVQLAPPERWPLLGSRGNNNNNNNNSSKAPGTKKAGQEGAGDSAQSGSAVRQVSPLEQVTAGMAALTVPGDAGTESEGCDDPSSGGSKEGGAKATEGAEGKSGGGGGGTVAVDVVGADVTLSDHVMDDVMEDVTGDCSTQAPPGLAGPTDASTAPTASASLSGRQRAIARLKAQLAADPTRRPIGAVVAILSPSRLRDKLVGHLQMPPPALQAKGLVQLMPLEGGEGGGRWRRRGANGSNEGKGHGKDGDGNTCVKGGGEGAKGDDKGEQSGAGDREDPRSKSARRPSKAMRKQAKKEAAAAARADGAGDTSTSGVQEAREAASAALEGSTREHAAPHPAGQGQGAKPGPGPTPGGHPPSSHAAVARFMYHYYLLRPVNPRLRMMMVESFSLPRTVQEMLAQPRGQMGRQPPEEALGMLLSARLHAWDGDSEWPLAQTKDVLGLQGDLAAESAALIYTFSLEGQEFPPEAMACLPPTPWQVPQEEVARRRDLRQQRVFSIDPPTARDLDDALSIQLLEEDYTGSGARPGGGGGSGGDGGGGGGGGDEGGDSCGGSGPLRLYRVGVHIADVSHFVPPGSALDDEARKRSTSVYFIREVIPMLPRLLCEELCSLNPGVDRLTFSVMWDMTSDGAILRQWVGPTIIRSCAKLAYGTAQLMIDGTFDPDAPVAESEGHRPKEVACGWGWDDVVRDVRALNNLAVILRKGRFDKGALRCDNVKLLFRLDEDGLPVDYARYVGTAANALVEEWMLLANMSVAATLARAFPDRALLRRHPAPNERKLALVRAMCDEMGLEVDFSSSRSIQDALTRLEQAESHVVYSTIKIQLTKPMQLAQYFCTGEAAMADAPHDWHHYGLAVPFYTHFTSPIRRYPDVLVHRLLRAVLAAEAELGTLAQGGAARVAGGGSDNQVDTMVAVLADGDTALALQPMEEGEEGVEGVSSTAGGTAAAAFCPFSAGMRDQLLADTAGIPQPALSNTLARAAAQHGCLARPELEEVALHCNERKLRSKEAQESCDKFYLASFLRDRPVITQGMVLSLGAKFLTICFPSFGHECRVTLADDGLEGTAAAEDAQVVITARTSPPFSQRKPARGATESGQPALNGRGRRKARREAREAAEAATAAAAAAIAAISGSRVARANVDGAGSAAAGSGIGSGVAAGPEDTRSSSDPEGSSHSTNLLGGESSSSAGDIGTLPGAKEGAAPSVGNNEEDSAGCDGGADASPAPTVFYHNPGNLAPVKLPYTVKKYTVIPMVLYGVGGGGTRLEIRSRIYVENS
eukprot:jgi/Mesvir1/19462/Mv10488-RA.1